MSRVKVITELARKTGSSWDEAKRIVDEHGVDGARQMIRDLDDGISWKIPATATAGGGTALAWRQQDVWMNRSEADQTEAEEQTVQDILARDDLTTEEKRALIEQLRNQGDGDDGTLLDDLFGDDLQQTIVMLVVALVVISFALNYATNLGQSIGGASAGVSVGGGA